MSTNKDIAPGTLEGLSLPAMLSTALIAFTVEADNELDRRLAGPGGATPSLVVWLNVMQYLPDEQVTVAELCAKSRTSMEQVRFLIGKLQHWGELSVETKSASSKPSAAAGPLTGGRQNISGIKPHSVVEISERVKPAAGLWPGVIDEVESRWRLRWGSTLNTALKAASKLADQPGVLMPDAVPAATGHRIRARTWGPFTRGKLEAPSTAQIPVLLSRALMAAAIAYEDSNSFPLALGANTLRVIDDEGTPESQLHLLSGTAPETAASQSKFIKEIGLAEVVKDPSRRGKLMRLTPAGKEAQEAHTKSITDVEAALDPDGKAASALRRLLSARHDGDLAIRAALTPPPGSRRFSTEWVVHRPVDERDHQIVAQAEAFRSDPFGALPHYPVWEATRGFRP